MSDKEENDESGLIRMDDEAQLIRTDTNTLSALNRSEIEAQMDAAHRYPRSTTRFQKEARTLACATKEIAASCMYTLERKDKNGKKVHIVGPSIRLAEICASTYQNLHAGGRPLDVDETTVTAQGVCWDVQRNVRIVTEAKRRITTSTGRRYGEDMIIMTQNAACSIALRNAIFRVIPRSLVDAIFVHVRQMAVGQGKTMEQRRQDVIAGMGRLGVPVDRVLAALERDHADDLTLEDIEALIGYGTRIQQGEDKDSIFPPIGPTAPIPGEVGKREPIKRPEPTKLSEPTKEAAPKPAVKSGGPAGDDLDAADRAAAAPTPEELAEMEQAAVTKAKKNNGTTDEETPPWLKK